MMKSLAALRTAAERLPREPYRVDRPVDERGQYQFWYRDHPTRQPGVSREELAEIAAGGGAPEAQAGVPWRRLFRSRQLWLIMAMYWCYVWGSIFYLGWFPTYLVKGRGLTEGEMGLYAALPFMLGAIGNALGGRLGDRLVRRYGLSLGRRLMGSTCLLISAGFLIATALTTGKISGVVLLALGFGVMDCMLPSAWSLCLDVGGRYSGAVSGAMNTAGSARGLRVHVAVRAPRRRFRRLQHPDVLHRRNGLDCRVSFLAHRSHSGN